MVLIFESTFSPEEIEQNFENTDLYESLMAALQEALRIEQQIKKERQ